MNTISYIIEEKPGHEFLIRNISFDIDLATKQFETSASLFDSYLQGGDTTYAKNAETYLRYTNIYLDSIPKCVARYEAAINTYKQRQAAQAAELQRQQELKRQQNAAFWGGILSAFIQGAANAVTGGVAPALQEKLLRLTAEAQRLAHRRLPVHHQEKLRR